MPSFDSEWLLVMMNLASLPKAVSSMLHDIGPSVFFTWLEACTQAVSTASFLLALLLQAHR